ncbi:MAG: tryptophan--tRNA ligase [Gammaproteobacteria bacterium]|jgi:tryptophanyl-tRNA synthetase
MTDFFEGIMTTQQRILSGMRPTGGLHLGHYHGVLKNWLKLQHEYDCFFGVVDLHALTTEYATPEKIKQATWDMVIDWLAAGVNPGAAHIFIQSKVPEISELHVLLSMITPLSWLERMPTYKDQQQKLKDKDLSTYGFLGYPLLQAADILVFKSDQVPVGEDQVPHVELAREIARRFNHLYGRDADYQQKAESAIKKLGKKQAKLYRELMNSYQEKGKLEALEKGRALVEGQGHLTLNDRERLFGYLEGGGKIILPEPEALLTDVPQFPGLDGQKMSKSYHNTIGLREDPKEVETKIRTMPTDPARIRRTDPGDPKKCPVWKLHKVYSDDEVKNWVCEGCRSASIGCIDCKKPLIEAIIKEQAPIREQAQKFVNNPNLVRTIVAEGCEAARDVAKQTIEEVQDIIGLA